MDAAVCVRQFELGDVDAHLAAGITLSRAPRKGQEDTGAEDQKKRGQVSEHGIYFLLHGQEEGLCVQQ